MATNTNYNYNLGNTTTTEKGQTNKTTTDARTDKTIVSGRTDTTTTSARTDTSKSNQNSSTNKQANDALNKAYNTKATLGTAHSLGYSQGQLDQDKLLGLYNKAAQTQYKGNLQALDASRQEYGKALMSAQDNYLQAMRQANASAITSGAARGTQAANELSAVLGLQQESMQGATDLANQRAQAGIDYANALAEAQVNAEDTTYNRQKAITEQLLQKYTSDNDVLGMLGYGALGDYVTGNTDVNTNSTNVTGKQTTTNDIGEQTTTNNIGKQVTTENIGKKVTTSNTKKK